MTTGSGKNPALGDRVKNRECGAEGVVVQVRLSARRRTPPVIEVKIDRAGDDGWHLYGRTVRSSFKLWAPCPS